MAGPKAPPPQDGIYRAILIVLVVSVVGGVTTALVGEHLLHAEAVSRAGAWLAIVCGAIYFFFRWLGRRESSRRAKDPAAGDGPPGASDRDR